VGVQGKQITDGGKLLWRTTGDVVRRERGWVVFEAILNVARVEGSGFAISTMFTMCGSETRPDAEVGDCAPTWNALRACWMLILATCFIVVGPSQRRKYPWVFSGLTPHIVNIA
jgi:hypothetical protein